MERCINREVLKMIKCNNCDTLFENDEDLEIQHDGRTFYLGCDKCHTDSFLMDIKEK